MILEEYKQKLMDAHRKRGEVLTNFAVLEVSLQEFVIYSYMGKLDLELQAEVFQDAHFGFSLLKSIFTTVIKKSKNEKFYNEYKKNCYQSVLEELVTLRNVFAHGTQGMNEVEEVSKIASDNSEFIITHPHVGTMFKTPYRNHTVEFLYQAFIVRYNKIKPFIVSLPGVCNKVIYFK